MPPSAIPAAHADCLRTKTCASPPRCISKRRVIVFVSISGAACSLMPLCTCRCVVGPNAGMCTSVHRHEAPLPEQPSTSMILMLHRENMA